MSSIIASSNPSSKNLNPGDYFYKLNPEIPADFDNQKDTECNNRRLLDNKGNNYPKGFEKNTKQELRKLKNHMWKLLGRMKFPNKSMRLCGTGLHHESKELTIKVDKKGSVYASGLATCKNHKCAWCAPIKEQQHILRIKKQLEEAIGQGRQVAFVTSTAGFYVNSDFKHRVASLSKSFYETCRQLNKKHPSERMRRIEDTVNDRTNQPHYHLHALLDFKHATKENRLEIEQEYLRRFNENIRKHDSVKGHNPEAQRVIWIDCDKGISEYISKSLAYEVSSRTTKVGKKKDSMSWFEWFKSHDTETFTDKKKKLAYGMLNADFKSQTITFSKGWYKEEEDEMDKEETKENETISVVNPHSGIRFMRFHYKGYNSDRLFALMSAEDKYRDRFSAICFVCDDYLVENPYSYHEAGLLMECLLRDWVDEILSLF